MLHQIKIKRCNFKKSIFLHSKRYDILNVYSFLSYIDLSFDSVTTALSHPTDPTLEVLAPRPFLIVNYEQITPVVILSVHVKSD